MLFMARLWLPLHQGLHRARCPRPHRGPHRESVLPTLHAELSHTSENRWVYKTIPLPTPYFFKKHTV